MSKKRTALWAIFALALCMIVYFMNNHVTIDENTIPQQIRVLHLYNDVPGASNKNLSDEYYDHTSDTKIFHEVMDELEGTYLKLPIPADFYRNEKNLYELCINWKQNKKMDVDVYSNGRVVINGDAYLRLDDDTDELYWDLLEHFQ